MDKISINAALNVINPKKDKAELILCGAGNRFPKEEPAYGNRFCRSSTAAVMEVISILF